MVAPADDSRVVQSLKACPQTINKVAPRHVHDRAVPGLRQLRNRLPADSRPAVRRTVLDNSSLRPDFGAPALPCQILSRTGANSHCNRLTPPPGEYNRRQRAAGRRGALEKRAAKGRVGCGARLAIAESGLRRRPRRLSAAGGWKPFQRFEVGVGGMQRIPRRSAVNVTLREWWTRFHNRGHNGLRAYRVFRGSHGSCTSVNESP